jgi:benzoyl-CoA reductase subunit A
MRCVVGIDLGSTTTKAILLDESGAIAGRGVTNSRSSYEAASAVARQEALTDARMTMLEREMERRDADGAAGLRGLLAPFQDAFRLEVNLLELVELEKEMERVASPEIWPEVRALLEDIESDAEHVFGGAERKSDFFRDMVGTAYMARAEQAAKRGAPFERLMSVYDRSILDVETKVVPRDLARLFQKAGARVAQGAAAAVLMSGAVEAAATTPIDELSFVGTGYGRQTLPFPADAVRSEILCHGRGAHRQFAATRTVLDIGGQDTKAIQVDGRGVVTSFQMNDRCAAGCGRYLGYVADELNLGLHELGPLALQARRSTKVNSTCTVFAGAELKERLGLGERREDILAGLHRAIMLRAMSLLARSGGVFDQMTFTGGVARNPMAVQIARELVAEGYGGDITVNVDPGSIYTGALGAAMFALDDVRAGRESILPAFAREEVCA